MTVLSLLPPDLICLLAILTTIAQVPLATQSVIGGVAVESVGVSPATGERAWISYVLARPDTVTILIYDSDGRQVRCLCRQACRELGGHKESWDGRDDEGQLVPDEAYTFTIETPSGAVYDPWTFSGGRVGDITSAEFSREAGTVVYSLPAPSRVAIRLGIKNGPMLKTLVDWKPRMSGVVTEYWDGLDEDKIIPIDQARGFVAMITYVTLPEATVITYGNREETYHNYVLGRGKNRPEKPERSSTRSEEPGLNPKGLVQAGWAPAPRVAMTFPEHDRSGGWIPRIRKVADVHVDVDQADRQQLFEQQFEVVFFVDNVFFAEAERGYVPMNWRWELNQVLPGEHILTVNISSSSGQVGVASRKVLVVE